MLQGYKALEFWRLREDFGLGSDLQRIQRDQLLMVGLVQKILKTGVLHSVSKTWSLINAISQAHALTTDAGLTPSRIVKIGRSLAGISRKSIQFVEVPTVDLSGQPELGGVRHVADHQAVRRYRARPRPAQDRQGRRQGQGQEARQGSRRPSW